MPCKDSSSRVMVTLDADERLLDFDFSKITCSQEIGGETGYKRLCVGKSIEEIAGLEFNDLVRELKLDDPEAQFFLYLEWDALRTAIAQYQGKEEEVDAERYQVASIAWEDGRIEISQVIRPPTEMPKIIPCSRRVESS